MYSDLHWALSKNHNENVRRNKILTDIESIEMNFQLNLMETVMTAGLQSNLSCIEHSSSSDEDSCLMNDTVLTVA